MLQTVCAYVSCTWWPLAAHGLNYLDVDVCRYVVQEAWCYACMCLALLGA